MDFKLFFRAFLTFFVKIKQIMLITLCHPVKFVLELYMYMYCTAYNCLSLSNTNNVEIKILCEINIFAEVGGEPR